MTEPTSTPQHISVNFTSFDEIKHVIKVQPGGSTQTRNHHVAKLVYLNIRKFGNNRKTQFLNSRQGAATAQWQFYLNSSTAAKVQQPQSSSFISISHQPPSGSNRQVAVLYQYFTSRQVAATAKWQFYLNNSTAAQVRVPPSGSFISII